MKQLQQLLITRLVACGALKFGDFTLKSGRQSPYFFNSGDLLASGSNLDTVAGAFAKHLATMVKQSECSYLFGPAYKGISIAATSVAALAHHYQISLPWGYNRKEIKDHGEGGALVGALPQGKVVLVDDVLTSGMAVREVIELLHKHDATPHALLLLLDREEAGPSGTMAARDELTATYGIRVHSLLRFRDLIEWLRCEPGKAQLADKLTEYAKNTFSSNKKA